MSFAVDLFLEYRLTFLENEVFDLVVESLILIFTCYDSYQNSIGISHVGKMNRYYGDVDTVESVLSNITIYIFTNFRYNF